MTEQAFNWDIIPQQDEIKTLWVNATFVFDTNVLLDLYRYQNETKEALLTALKKLSDNNQIWLPNRVASEFIKNRRKVIIEAKQAYDDTNKILKEMQDECLKKFADIKKNRKIPQVFKEETENAIASLFQSKISCINELANEEAKQKEIDTIFNSIKKMFGNNIGTAYPVDEIDKLIKEATERTKIKMPPGITDTDKHNPEEQCGDLIIWKQILEYSKKNRAC